MYAGDGDDAWFLKVQLQRAQNKAVYQLRLVRDQLPS